jgi:hypothetical protein
MERRRSQRTRKGAQERRSQGLRPTADQQAETLQSSFREVDGDKVRGFWTQGLCGPDAKYFARPISERAYTQVQGEGSRCIAATRSCPKWRYPEREIAATQG